MKKFKKKILWGILLVVPLLIIPTVVFAQSSYWNNFFNELGSIPAADFSCSGPKGCSIGGLKTWENHSYKSAIADNISGGMGGTHDERLLDKIWYTENEIYLDMNSQDVTSVTSSNSGVLEAQVTDYDFSEEEKKFNEYLAKYEKFSLEEINMGIREPFKEKPTWWEYTNKVLGSQVYESEPHNWWEAYGYKQKPTAIEVSYKAHDFGSAKITLNSSTKGNIDIDWVIGVRDFVPFPTVFQKELKNKSQGLVEVLNNLSKYKGYYPERNDQQKYNFSYGMEKGEDLSEVINALKGKDITVKFYIYDSLSGISDEYYLNGKDIKSTVGKGFTYYYDISMTNSVNKDKIESLVSLKNAIFIDFAYHGSLPTKFNLSVDANQFLMDKFVEQGTCNNSEMYNGVCDNKVKEFLNGNDFTLLYYNPDTNKMEVVKENLKPNQEGKFDLEFDHFSSYVLVRSDDYKVLNQLSNNAQTSSMDIVLYSSLSIGSLVGIAYILIRKRKKEIA